MLVTVDSDDWEIRCKPTGQWEALNLSFDPDQADFISSNRTDESTISLELPVDLDNRLIEFLTQSYDGTAGVEPHVENKLKREIAALIKAHLGES